MYISVDLKCENFAEILLQILNNTFVQMFRIALWMESIAIKPTGWKVKTHDKSGTKENPQGFLMLQYYHRFLYNSWLIKLMPWMLSEKSYCKDSNFYCYQTFSIKLIWIEK